MLFEDMEPKFSEEENDEQATFVEMRSVKSCLHQTGKRQSIHVSQVRKKVVVAMTMESSRTHRVARSACVYNSQLAAHLDRIIKHFSIFLSLTPK
jgi:hypothetical protein